MKKALILLILALLIPVVSLAQVVRYYPSAAEPNPRLRFNLYSDMGGAGASVSFAPFVNNALASGTGAFRSEANHPGVWVSSSSVNANSGNVVWAHQYTGLLLSGSEHFVFVFNQARFTDVAHIAGFFDVITVTAAADAVYLTVSTSGVLTGTTQTNFVGSVTPSSYTLTLGTWYRGEILLNATATLVTFYLYDCATGVLLWTDTLATNIPTAAGRELGVGWMVYHTGAAVFELASLDFIQAEIQRDLIR